MLGYLLGAYVTCITLGSGDRLHARTRARPTRPRHPQPDGRHRVGRLALVGAWVVWSGRQQRIRERRRARKAAKPHRAHRGGSASSTRDLHETTFLVGMLLTLPGASYLAGLDEIHKLNHSTTVTVLLGDRIRPGHALAARGPARQLRDRTGLDAPCDRASQGLRLPPCTHVRCEGTHPVRRTDHHQGHRRARRDAVVNPPVDEPRGKLAVGRGTPTSTSLDPAPPPVAALPLSDASHSGFLFHVLQRSCVVRW